MRGKQQKNQLKLAFESNAEVKPEVGLIEGAETLTAESRPESQTANERLMEEILGRENLKRALKRVEQNKGASGVDGMEVDELRPFLKQHWPQLREALENGTYKPQPVRRVEIPKGGGNVSGKDATENSTETMQAQPTNTTEPQPRTISDKS